MMFRYGADGSGIENISGSICSTNGKQSWTTLYSSRLIRQFWLDILSYVIQLILKFCLYFYQSVCPCLPGSCQYSKYRSTTFFKQLSQFRCQPLLPLPKRQCTRKLRRSSQSFKLSFASRNFQITKPSQRWPSRFIVFNLLQFMLQSNTLWLH